MIWLPSVLVSSCTTGFEAWYLNRHPHSLACLISLIICASVLVYSLIMTAVDN